LVDQGVVKHLGVSNETPWGLMEYKRLEREKGYAPIQSIQNPYSLLNRSFEVGLAEVCIREQISCLAYSPLGNGVLSGKYLNGQQPKGARLTEFDRFTRYSSPESEKATEAYVALAKEHGLDPAQMAIAFVNDRDFMGSNIIGATTMAQLQSNLATAEINLSTEVLKGIENIHNHCSNPAP
jgi:aryl-alcohol dehydrogenase-like predicted oxidoreductase